jgi:hypothetical protein
MAMLSPDERPLMLCRLELPQHMTVDVDGWMPKHFDDSLDADAVTSAAAFSVLHNFDPVSGLPWIFNGHGNRFIVYVVQNPEMLLSWIDSPSSLDAIKDGQDREGAYPFLDNEPFNGAIYLSSRVIRPLGVDFIGPTSLFIERFDVGAERDEEFTAWLEGPHADAVAAVSDVLRVRTYRQNLDVPKRFPFDRYSGKGNRMLMAELPVNCDLVEFVKRREVVALLADSIRWDLELPYVRREVANFQVLRNKEDALGTFIERHGNS